jgi:hypothetical protein
MVLLLLLRVARVRTPANSFVLWRLDFTHGRWRINMGRGDVMGVRMLRLPMSRLRHRCCYFGY